MKHVFILLLFMLPAHLCSMADPNFVPAFDNRKEANETKRRVDEQEKKDDKKTDNGTRIQAQEAADQENDHDKNRSDNNL